MFSVSWGEKIFFVEFGEISLKFKVFFSTLKSLNIKLVILGLFVETKKLKINP